MLVLAASIRYAILPFLLMLSSSYHFSSRVSRSGSRFTSSPATSIRYAILPFLLMRSGSYHFSSLVSACGSSSIILCLFATTLTSSSFSSTSSSTHCAAWCFGIRIG